LAMNTLKASAYKYKVGIKFGLAISTCLQSSANRNGELTKP
jgi:hypothetical protein